MNLANKKRIVFFGCSFTSGHELMDHDFLGISFDECNKLKERHLLAKKSVGKFDSYVKQVANIDNDQYNNMSSKKSYGAKLASKLQLEHVNYAEPGLSMEHSFLKLIYAFHSGKLNSSTDLIFLGMTTPHRYMYFTTDGVPITKVMGHLNYSPEDLHYTDHKIMQSYYFSLENFKNFCLVNSFDFVLQPVVNKGLLLTGIVDPEYEMFMDINRDWKYIPMFTQMLKNSLEYCIDCDETLVSKYDPETHGVCGFKHPTEIAHEFFAEALYDKIISKKVQGISY